MGSELITPRQLGLTLAVAFLCMGSGVQAADLPVSCAAGSCTGGPAVWVTGGAATAVTNPAGTRLDISQTTDQAILNWAEFNIAAGKTVNFSQPGKAAVALNRIYQSDPSRIFGALTANGQVYLINQNGILFGSGSQVNVGSLVASSLAIADEAASGGILNPNLLLQGKPAFDGQGRVFVVDQNGQVVTDAAGQPVPVKVVVQMGATIRSDPKGGGRIALLGQQVENAGRLEAPAGQIVLAAGQKVYLQASTDPDLRGLLVEVDAGGKAWNQLTGQISSPLGNTTLVGLAVNQDGRINATTSVRSNGSVRLLARDSVNVNVALGGGVTVAATNGGTVEFGSGSRVDVLPDATDTETAVDEQAQSPSRVEVSARQIHLASGSTIVASGGQVSMAARQNPGLARPGGANPLPVEADAGIRLDAGSLIDVSGSTATTSVTRNAVAVELRANELRDSPLQRDGALRGKTVVVDARVGTPLADVSGAIASIKRDVFERTSAGGTVALESRGAINMAEGATVNVSGGQVVYTAGSVRTSQLVTSDGSVVDISRADPDVVYTGVRNPETQQVYGKWGVVRSFATPGLGTWDPGYVDGQDAGTVSFAAPGLVLGGTLAGHSAPGILQRSPATAPQGGRLIVGLADGQRLPFPDYLAPSIHFSNGPVTGGGTGLNLPTGYLSSGGFTRTELYSNGVISLDAATRIELAPGSSLRLTGSAVALDGQIVAPGGEVVAASANVNASVREGSSSRPGVSLGNNAAIDTSGLWINDGPGIGGGTDRLFVNGGTISLDVPTPDGELRIGDNVSLRSDAGAWLTSSSKLVAGKAGQIALQARGNGVALATGRDVLLSAYGLTKGGTLTLAAGQIQVAGSGPQFAVGQRNEPLAGDAVPYLVSPDLFASGGFQQYNLVATGGRLSGPADGFVEPLEVAPGTLVQPRLSLRSLAATFATAATGTPIGDFSEVLTPADYQRPAAGVALSVQPATGVTVANAGDLYLAAGSRLATDPGGTVALTAPTRVRIDGQIDAPAGSVAVRLSTPSGGLDQGYDPAAGIFIASTALLRATGAALLQPSDIGLRSGEVRDGGTISLTAERGVVNLAAGSTLDVSGTAAVLDLPSASTTAGSASYESRTVGSRGGAIAIVAPEGLALAGNLVGRSGLDGAARPEAGSLSIGLSRLLGFTTDPLKLPTYPAGPRQLILGSAAAPAAGDPDGTGRFDPAAATRGGFDSVRVQADDAIVFGEDTSWTLSNALQLEAPAIRAGDGAGSVNLAANYLAIGPRILGLARAEATNGPASLRASAGLIDFFGNAALQGFGTAEFRAGSDLRATGLPTGDTGTSRLAGTFNLLGDLTLTAAQIYPTTLTNFEITAGDGAGTIRILPGTSAAMPALAGGGQLALEAADIVQGGTLRAPLGEISLEATRSLTLAAGSLTSVSAGGQLIPFGRVQGTTDWVYEIRPGVFASIGTPPAKQITLDGATVDVAAGATVDIAGGGDLYAYEFIPGPGGSTDALTAQQNPNLFAVVPGLGSFGAYDTQEYAGSGLRPGDSVRLEGVPGVLAAGTYALLPSRYALLPGAVLVETLPAVRDLSVGAGIGLSDGAPVVAGYVTVAGTQLADSRSTGFAVRPGSYGQQLAEYDISNASAFFARKAAAADQVAPLLPADAGLLQIQVGDALALDGSLRATPGKDGRGSRVDLSALRLRIVAALGSAVDGVVDVLADALTGLGAESLLLGGTRSAAADGTHVALAADAVTVAGGASLMGPEIILAAREGITLESGSDVAAAGAPGAASAGETLLIDGGTGGALVRVSRDAQADVLRAVGATATGDVQIQAGARLAASGSLAIDAAGTARSFGQIEADGAAVSLGSGRLVLAADQSGVDDGLALTNDQLAAFSGSSELRLIGRQAIDFAGPVVVGPQGGAQVARLILDSPLLAGAGAAASLDATEVILRNSGAAATLPPGEPGGGNLDISGDVLRLDGGSFAIQGFAGVLLAGRNGVAAAGETSLLSGGDLTIRAPVITGWAGSDLNVQASGHTVRFEARTAGAAGPLPGLGAGLDVDAGTIFADTRLLYPSGSVRLAADGDLVLGGNAAIDAAGRQVALGPATVATPGGAVTLVSRAGGVSVAAGARVDVSSGGGERAAAGSIGVLAGGNADLAGEFEGSGSTAVLGGAIRVLAGTISDLSGLNQGLDSGGFSRSREFQTGSDDLTIAAGDRIQAREVTIVANGGALLVDGAIDARADGGGGITLGARDELRIGAGAVLDAGNTAATGRGGSVSLMTSAGSIDVAEGAEIRVPGAGDAATGEVLLRAPASGDDVGIGSIASTISGAAAVIIEPVVKALVGSVLDDSTLADLRASLDTFMASAGDAIRSRLGLAGLPGAAVRPGLEVDAPGDLLLASDLDLADWRYAGEPGYLTIRAAGDLSLQGNLSDGFLQTDTALVQVAGPTWSYRLVGGADRAAVLPLETRGRLIDSPAAGSIELGDGFLIRTGTGSIQLAAAADLVLAGPGSAIYTAGIPAADPLNLGGGSAALRRNWLRDGGDITLLAARDILAQTPEQLVTDWSVRTVTGGQARWAIDVGRFRQGIGALGGGNVLVAAGRDIRSLSALVATTSTADPAAPGNFPVWGGGDIDVQAGRDILSGFYSTWQGVGLVRAGRDIALDPAEALGVSTLLSFGTGQVSVTARRDLQLDGVINPTTIAPANSGGAVFYSYGASDALDLTAIGGNLRLLNDPSTVVGTLFGDATQTLAVYPATVRASAPSGDIDIDRGMQLLPAPRGQLEMIAAGSLRVDNNGVSILLADTDPASIPVASRPTLDPLTVVAEFASAAIHAGDAQPVLLVAAGGNMTGGNYELAKHFTAYAARDIRDLEIFGQNTAPGQISVVQAGRDIVLDQIANELELGGPGRLQVLAGRSLNLGFSRGISTIGSTRNPQLPPGDGAALDAWLGLAVAPAYQAFITRYLVDGRDYDRTLIDYMKGLTGQVLPAAEALAAFSALDRERQRPLVESIFFRELRESGREANLDPATGFTRGLAAVDRLYPPAATYTGDLSMFFSRIYTLAGGDINLLVPGGLVNVGLANLPRNLPVVKKPSDLGIVTQGPGAIRIFSRGDVLVNQSRVFTLQGGDIVIWSSEGNIDAGRGAKSAISAPPPTITVSATGQIQVQFSDAIAGSGIRGILTNDDIKPGDVDLIAPSGEINAGDAGIGSAGNINIAAPRVVGLDNIQVGGVATGVPADAGGIGAALSGASGLGASAAKAAESTSAADCVDANRDGACDPAGSIADAALGWLEVFIEGFGEPAAGRQPANPSGPAN